MVCENIRVEEVLDPDDPRLDDFRDLALADRRPDRPGGRGLVIAEGTNVVQRLLASPFPVRCILGVRDRISMIKDLPANTYVTSPEIMAKVVGFHLNRGVLAAADRIARPSLPQLLAQSRSVAILEGVGDHENLGALFRNAAAMNVDAILLGPGCADPLYRRSVRVSMGYVLRIPFTNLVSDWPRSLSLLPDNGFTIAALTPRADAIALPDLNLTNSKIAWLLGTEGAGLTDVAIAAADLAVRIPMAQGVDSLNVATAAAIAFYAGARW